MSFLRLQNNTPDVYVDNSRDFQLLCRVYDCVINGVKFDVDTMEEITDTQNCNDRLLQLLAMKVGYVNTNTHIDSNALRYMSSGFPVILKKKGSREAIQEAINVFMKIKHIKSSVDIVIVNELDND